MSNEIPFTRFHAPDGRRSQTSITVDDETYAAWKRVEAAGFRMTVELLSTGHVSQCIEDRELGDFDCVITPNGPEVVVKLKQMLMRFNDALAKEWRKGLA